jgi:hypothetical protein
LGVDGRTGCKRVPIPPTRSTAGMSSPTLSNRRFVFVFGFTVVVQFTLEDQSAWCEAPQGSHRSVPILQH